MGVHEAREHVLARGVDDVDLVAGRQPAGLAQLGDPPVADEDVVGLVDVGARVQDLGAANEQVIARADGVEQAPRTHHATAARIGEPTSSS